MPTAIPVVLVHGFWHGSWCWSALTEELAGREIASVAIDLAGHGLNSSSPQSRWARPFDPIGYATEVSPVADVTASSAAAELVEQIRRIGQGRPCVVVAHSMGGVVATAAAELAPELFAELVYLTAFAPVSGLPAGAYIGSPENAGEQVSGLLVGDPFAIGALRIDAVGQAAAVRETFYQDVDERTGSAAIAMLSSDGPAGVPGEAFAVTPERFGSIGHTYLVCTRDNAIPVALQRRFVAEIDAVSVKPTTVVELDASHSPFFSQPVALADAVEAVVGRRAVPA